MKRCSPPATFTSRNSFLSKEGPWCCSNAAEPPYNTWRTRHRKKGYFFFSFSFLLPFCQIMTHFTIVFSFGFWKVFPYRRDKVHKTFSKCFISLWKSKKNLFLFLLLLMKKSGIVKAFLGWFLHIVHHRSNLHFILFYFIFFFKKTIFQQCVSTAGPINAPDLNSPRMHTRR